MFSRRYSACKIQSMKISSELELTFSTFYHSFPSFNDPELKKKKKKKKQRKHCGKRRKAAFSYFPTMFSPLSNTETSKLSSQIAINSDQSKILWYSTELGIDKNLTDIVHVILNEVVIIANSWLSFVCSV